MSSANLFMLLLAIVSVQVQCQSWNDASLVALWQFNTADAGLDSSPNNNHLTSYNNPTLVDGAVCMDGATQYLGMPGDHFGISVVPTGLPVGGSSYSYAFHFKINGPPQAGKSAANSWIGWGDYSTTGGSNAYRDGDGWDGYHVHNYWWGDDLQVDTHPHFFMDGQWHTTAVTFDSATTVHTVYLDGVQVTQVTRFHLPNVQGQNFAIGTQNRYSQFLWGCLDDMGIWSRALTADEVAAFHANANLQPPLAGIVVSFSADRDDHEVEPNGQVTVHIELSPAVAWPTAVGVMFSLAGTAVRGTDYTTSLAHDGILWIAPGALSAQATFTNSASDMQLAIYAIYGEGATITWAYPPALPFAVYGLHSTPITLTPTATATPVGSRSTSLSRTRTPSTTHGPFNPAVTCTLSTSNLFLTAPGSATVTATLSRAVAVDVVVSFTVSGDAVRNVEYSVNPSFVGTSNTIRVTVPAGQTSAVLTVTGTGQVATRARGYAVLNILPTSAAGVSFAANTPALFGLRFYAY